MIYILIFGFFYNVLLYSKQELIYEDTLYIYLVKHHWHTGILFEVAHVDPAYWPEITELKEYNFVDVGWGDAEFYQHPGFDPALAVQALFYSQGSTLRIEGITFSLARYIKIMDLVIKIPVSLKQFNALCKYVADNYSRDSTDRVVILSQAYGGNVRFYRANQMYNLFNTCNTWVAKGFLSAGFDISPAQIIFVEDLVTAAEEFGTIINYETPE